LELRGLRGDVVKIRGIGSGKIAHSIPPRMLELWLYVLMRWHSRPEEKGREEKHRTFPFDINSDGSKPIS
jgi:hypothetical protein